MDDRNGWSCAWGVSREKKREFATLHSLPPSFVLAWKQIDPDPNRKIVFFLERAKPYAERGFRRTRRIHIDRNIQIFKFHDFERLRGPGSHGTWDVESMKL